MILAKNLYSHGLCAHVILIYPQVISIILDPYYRNKTEIFKSEEYHAGVILMRIPTNLFGLPKKHKFNVSYLDVEIRNFCSHTNTNLHRIEAQVGTSY